MIFGLGPFELLMLASVFVYIYYNGYMLWKTTAGDMEYGEEQ